ncbi:MAG: serine hydrolase [Bacteroidota bacterium]
MKKRVYLFVVFSCISCFAAAQALSDTAILKRTPGIYSLLLSKNDKIVYEQYFNQQDKNTLFNDQSLTKSVVSLLIGIAIDKGYIKSVDEKLTDFFPQLKTDKDKRKQQITLRQVMNQASGLYHEDLEKLGDWLHIADPANYVIKAPLTSDPGKVFHYSNAASHLLSVILTKSTRMDTKAFADKYLFGPLNIKSYEWEKMRDGYYDGSGLLSIRLRSADMLKLGLLVLHKGKYGKAQVVSQAWVNATINPTITYPTPWGFEQSAYALCWYHKVYNGAAITYALGWGGQFMFIIPSLNAVVMVNQPVEDSEAIKRANSLIYKLFPAIFKELNPQK